MSTQLVNELLGLDSVLNEGIMKDIIDSAKTSFTSIDERLVEEVNNLLSSNSSISLNVKKRYLDRLDITIANTILYVNEADYLIKDTTVGDTFTATKAMYKFFNKDKIEDHKEDLYELRYKLLHHK
ncbi:MAG: hypothetical protein [Bacteriophage sp.]|nr:MAG: hypothetical protein [Bacteriophage sp.]